MNERRIEDTGGVLEERATLARERRETWKLLIAK
jgi:hypothetical protein